MNREQSSRLISFPLCYSLQLLAWRKVAVLTEALRLTCWLLDFGRLGRLYVGSSPVLELELVVFSWA